MAEYSELVQALTWLLTNRIQQKIEYTHGLLGDGNGRVRVSTAPGSPEVDYVYVRPDRFSDRTFKVFNKRIEGQDGDPVIIGELPWEPDLIQVVDMDWAAYADVGWGDDITTTNRHGISHQWRDGAPGIDTFNVYRRQFGDLKTYPAVSGTVAVGVSPYSLDIYGAQYQWPGIQAFSLAGAIPVGTGTARMALVYWSPASGTTGYLGVASGTLGSSAEATILNRPVTPEGAIPSAFVRLKGGQTSITEFDIWDAREPFRPGILFGTGSAAALNASLIPILDNSGLYTGSTVEAALEQLGYDAARVSKVYESDFGAVALQTDATGNVTINGTGTLTLPSDIIHSGDTDTKISFTDDDIEFAVGGLSLLKLTETTQDLITLGPGSGDVDINFNGDMFLQGSDGFLGLGTSAPSNKLDVVGSIELDATSGVGRVASLTNPKDISGFAAISLYPVTGTNTNSSLFVTPKGTGVTNNLSQILVFNTDYIADATNYEFAAFRARGSNFYFSSGAAGTGIVRPFILSAGFLGTGATNENQLYLATDGNIGLGLVPSTKLDIGDGAIEFDEMTAPSGGAVNTARLFARDNGAGKTQLCVIFNTGAIQVLATEP